MYQCCIIYCACTESLTVLTGFCIALLQGVGNVLLAVMYTYCLINWMASSYFIPLSISARATSTGALQYIYIHTRTHTQCLIPGNITLNSFCVCTAHRNDRFSRKSDPFSPSQQRYHLIACENRSAVTVYIFFEWKDALLYSLHYSLFITKSYYMDILSW